MAQNAFRTYKGKWLMKEYNLDTSAGAVEKGDLIEIDNTAGNSVELATNDAVCIVGIAAEDLADAAADQTIRVWVPNELKAEMIGRITDGVAVVGTDVNRHCDVEDHEGADVDTDSHHHLLLVRVTKACTDGNVGEGVFRITQPEELSGAF